MYKTIVLLLASLPAFGQLSLTPTGPASSNAGTAITVNLNIAGSTSAGPTALEWSLNLPAGYTVSAATLSTYASTTAQKTLSCNSTRTKCQVWGMNVFLIGPGTVASLTIQVPANASGSAIFGLTGVIAANASAASMPITAGPNYTLSITMPINISDINGDGGVNQLDVLAIVTQSVVGTCSNDQNADGKCDLNDVLVVLKKALGI